MLVLFGASSGPVPPFDLIQLSGKGSSSSPGPRFGTTSPRGPSLSGASEEVLGGAAKGELKLRTEHIYPLADAAQAQIDMESRKTTGKILLVP